MLSNIDVAVQYLQGMSWQGFEWLACEILEVKGYRDVERTEAGADLGIDGFAKTDDGLKVAFQCKHRSAADGKVGRPDIQSFWGAMQNTAVFGFFFTSGVFVQPALSLAAPATTPIVLCDARYIAEFALKAGLLVCEVDPAQGRTVVIWQSLPLDTTPSPRPAGNRPRPSQDSNTSKQQDVAQPSPSKASSHWKKVRSPNVNQSYVGKRIWVKGYGDGTLVKVEGKGRSVVYHMNFKSQKRVIKRPGRKVDLYLR